MGAHGNSLRTDLDTTIGEAPAQCEIEYRQLEGLTALSSPDEVKGVFADIVTGEQTVG